MWVLLCRKTITPWVCDNVLVPRKRSEYTYVGDTQASQVCWEKEKTINISHFSHQNIELVWSLGNSWNLHFENNNQTWKSLCQFKTYQPLRSWIENLHTKCLIYFESYQPVRLWIGRHWACQLRIKVSWEKVLTISRTFSPNFQIVLESW